MIKGAANFKASSRTHGKTYYPCDDLEFSWCEGDVREFDRMWQEGISLWDIAKTLKRDPDEVAILTIDRKRKGCINDRPGGAFGWNPIHQE